jgi:hypothetical protein
MIQNVLEATEEEGVWDVWMQAVVPPTLDLNVQPAPQEADIIDLNVPASMEVEITNVDEDVAQSDS